MLDKKEYAGGQRVYDLADDHLTYYYKNGRVKAEGAFKDGQMEGEWTFYRETGQLWQIGSFANGQKSGTFTRYDRNGHVEYRENFKDGKLVKAPSQDRMTNDGR